MELFDARGSRLYLTHEERTAFLDAAKTAPRTVRTFCLVLHYSDCRISEALALTPKSFDFSGKAIVFETLKKRRRGVYRAVPVPGEVPGHPEHGARASGGGKTAQTGQREKAPVGLGPNNGLSAGQGSDGSRRDRGRAAQMPQGAAPRVRGPCDQLHGAAEHALEVDGPCLAGGHGHLCQCTGRRTTQYRRPDVEIRLSPMNGSHPSPEEAKKA